MLTYTNLSETSITPVVLAVVGISILTGSYFSTRKIQQNGILNGAIVGIVYMLILYIISSMIFMDFSLELSSLIMIGCGMIAGIIGGIILVTADLIGRTMFAPVEVPIGIVTSIVGAPYFLYLLIRRKAIK